MEVGCGEFFSVILDQNGVVYTMGTNYLGQGDNSRSTMPIALEFADPQLPAGQSRKICKIAAGQRHCIAYADDDNKLSAQTYAWYVSVHAREGKQLICAALIGVTLVTTSAGWV